MVRSRERLSIPAKSSSAAFCDMVTRFPYLLMDAQA